LLDWGDSGVGHPLLDQPAFLDAIPHDAIGAVRAHWLQQWREAVPGSRPRPRIGPACPDRYRSAGGHLQALSRQHRAFRATLPPGRSSEMAEPDGRSSS
jgi:hypothetical protein